MHHLFRYLTASLFVLLTTFSFATPLPKTSVSEQPAVGIHAKSWGVLVYQSWMTNNNISNVLTFQNIHLKYGTMHSIDLSYKLAPQNPLRNFFNIEIATNISQRHDPNGLIYEFDPYLNFRWKKFPWNNIVATTLAIGDGLSYATGIPLREQHDSTNNNAKRLLNFLVVQASFAAPQYPDLQFVMRVNHRCGAWGLFGAGNLSSNAMGIGIRYLF